MCTETLMTAVYTCMCDAQACCHLHPGLNSFILLMRDWPGVDGAMIVASSNLACEVEKPLAGRLSRSYNGRHHITTDLSTHACICICFHPHDDPELFQSLLFLV